MIFIYAMIMLSVSIIFYGSRSKNRVMGQKVYACSRCRRPSYHVIVRSRRWFTLYFIPLIPTGKSTISRCNLCGYQEQINNEQADSWFSQDQTGSIVTPEKTPEQLMDEGTENPQWQNLTQVDTPPGSGQSPPPHPSTDFPQQPVPQYAGYPGTAAVRQPKNGLAIAGLVLGIIGVVTSWILVGIPFCIIGLVLAAVGMRRIEGKGVAIAGLILSIIGIAVGIGVIVAIIVSPPSTPSSAPICFQGNTAERLFASFGLSAGLREVLLP